jgi:predicted Fe-Mo cluster-binding NifX family protein
MAQIMQNKHKRKADLAGGQEKRRSNQMKFAVPLANGKLTAHFGHCQEFALIEVAENEIANTQLLIPPPHEPGVLPGWLDALGVDVIIAGGMGQRAIGLFSEKGIKVVTGAPSLEPDKLVKRYLSHMLVTHGNICDH